MENGTSLKNKAILVLVAPGREPQELIDEHLDELAFLAETAGITTLKRFIQHLPHPDLRSYVGKGKLAEIKDYVSTHKVNSIIVDDDLSPSQLRNLEKDFNSADTEEK